MKINNTFVQREIGGKTVVISVSTAKDAYQGMITLNSTGKYIWDMLSAGAERAEIYASLSKDYEISEAQAKTDADAFINKLVSEGVASE